MTLLQVMVKKAFFCPNKLCARSARQGLHLLDNALNGILLELDARLLFGFAKFLKVVFQGVLYGIGFRVG